jgi:outer membrane immunogenic protein
MNERVVAMNRFFLLGVAGLASAVGAAAFAADLPVKSVPFASRFSWTGCYAGAHAGGAWATNDVTDPVLLVQDNIAPGAPGFTAVSPITNGVNQSGAVVGGQIGCDYQSASNLVIGIEGAASGSTLKGSRLIGLRDSLPDTELVTVKTDFIPAVTGRFGYAFDRLLFYGKGGVAWASNKYSVTGSFTGAGAQVPGTAFDFEGLALRTGFTVGAGVEWAFTDDWSARVEYDYYGFGTQTSTLNDAVNQVSGPLSFKQTVQTIKLGINFHVPGWQ